MKKVMQNATRRIAAVQLEAELGDVSVNLERVEQLAKEALTAGADVVALPEFFTSRIAFDQRVHDAVLPPDNEAVDLLVSLAKQYGCWIGGSMLIAEDEEIYNRYYFVEPDGQMHTHDKDLPTMWENAFYGPGKDDGVFQTALGGVGAAVCWELIRHQTAKRLKDRVGLVMSGTHWWTLPANWGRLVNRGLAALGQYNRYLSEQAPSELARRIGAPVVQASHCGAFSGGFMLAPGFSASVPYETHYVGCTQIVDGRGQVLAQRRTSEGPGIVVSDVDVGSVPETEEIADRFWLPDHALLMKAYWHQQNLCGKSYYRRHGRAAGLLAAQRYEQRHSHK
ncbi:carbon-nitrogen hydrolase family protein [Marinobacter litoralis]|uniref:carbon-nitrogen hydrolase family protein n=1 Tax=Marinobacter litoralis TaxID=187981 RepID=UPI0018EBEDB9|nr:carbon-nitrogen hydrolase family protein [Marinobacter litoralis]MBJ6138141.1 carbon-nitrogen hydrolase family protein [Marinobacter litoralis]